jgi:hypothetical protein
MVLVALVFRDTVHGLQYTGLLVSVTVSALVVA